MAVVMIRKVDAELMEVRIQINLDNHENDDKDGPSSGGNDGCFLSIPS